MAGASLSCICGQERDWQVRQKRSSSDACFEYFASNWMAVPGSTNGMDTQICEEKVELRMTYRVKLL